MQESRTSTGTCTVWVQLYSVHVRIPTEHGSFSAFVSTQAELENTHTNVFSVFVFVQLYTGMAELTEYTIQVYNNCAHHARMKCTIQC